MRKVGRWAAVVVLGSSVLLAACSDDGPAAETSSKVKLADEAASARASKAETVDANAPVGGRDITYTADLVVRVANAERASDEATEVAEAARGYLAGQEADLQGERESTLILRVPGSRFRQVLDQLAGLGTVEDKGIDSADVTDQVVDLEGRLKSQQASVDRLRTLLSGAASTSDLVAIEKELSSREGEVESLQGQLRVLDDRVALATITVHLTEKQAEPGHHAPGFVDALEAGLSTLANVGRALLVALGFLLPFVPLSLIAWGGFRIWRRRHPRPSRRANPAWTPPTDRPPPPAPPIAPAPAPVARQDDEAPPAV